MRSHLSYHAILPALVVLLAPAVGSAAARAQSNAPRIVAIEVAGNRYVNDEAILLASGLRPGAAGTPGALTAARAAVARLGFFSIAGDEQRGVTIGTAAAASGVRVIIRVSEDPVVRSIKLTGTGPLRADALTPLLDVRPNTVLNLQTYAMDADRLQQAYARRGYVATVAPPHVDRDGTLEYAIHVGRLGPVVIAGVTVREAARLARELRRRVGDYYQTERFAKALRDLRLEPDPGGADPLAPESIPTPRAGQPIRLRAASRS